MTARLLCPIDDTDASKPAIVLAARLAHAQSARLILLVVNEKIGGYLKSEATACLWPSATVDRILADAEQTASQEGATEVEKVRIESREVAPAILAYAAEAGIDHIVIGSGGKGALSRMVLGSVSRAVVAGAGCSVTIAR